MDPASFFTSSRLLIVAGKGGVGKTTVSAALAQAAARVGLDALVLELDGRSGVSELYGAANGGYNEVVLAPADPAQGRGRITSRSLEPDRVLVDYLGTAGLGRLAGQLARSGAVEVVATAVPGIRDILVLGKAKQLERSGEADVIILDAPAAGHAISFLRSAKGLADAVPVGPIHTQAVEVLELLSNPSRCQVMLVTIAEETPVNELIDTAYALEDEVGVHLTPVVVNSLLSSRPGLHLTAREAAAGSGISLVDAEVHALDDAARFRLDRLAHQEGQADRLADQLALAQLRLPLVFAPELGVEALDQLAAVLLDEVGELSEHAT